MGFVMPKHVFRHMQTAKARSACAPVPIDQGLPCRPAESWDTTECMNGEQRHVSYFVHMQDGLNLCILYIQSNLDSLNTDGSFTMANSNSFLSPYEVLLIAQENKYSGKCSYFIVKLYVVCTH